MKVAVEVLPQLRLEGAEVLDREVPLDELLVDVARLGGEGDGGRVERAVTTALGAETADAAAGSASAVGVGGALWELPEGFLVIGGILGGGKILAHVALGVEALALEGEALLDARLAGLQGAVLDAGAVVGVAE